MVFIDETFTLKGWTAINLFVRDTPCLSVDLDLVFLVHTLPKRQALARINEFIRRAAQRLIKGRSRPACEPQMREKPSCRCAAIDPQCDPFSAGMPQIA